MTPPGSYVLALNLWDPHAGLALWAVLATAFLLGMVHGVTPDEHTWPITFSYAVGGYSSRAGMRNALIFSLAFTLQRALASELSYLALSRFLTLGSRANYVIYIIVGIAMIWAARYIRRGRLPWHVDFHLHWPNRASTTTGARPGFDEHGPDSSATTGYDTTIHGMHVHAHTHGGVAIAPPPKWSNDPCMDCSEPDLADPRAWMPALHGFIAGWGAGAFAVIVYTVLAPAMPSAVVGWVPGFVFGLGTTAVQVAVGGLVGWLVRRKGASPDVTRRIGLVVAARTLGIGGIAFVVSGLFGVSVPNLADLSVSTGIHVHNLDSLGLPLVLVVVSVAGVGVGSLISELRRVANKPREDPGLAVQSGSGHVHKAEQR
jgi:ABC-type nickel/cobalt efflux system permease component RcnA